MGERVNPYYYQDEHQLYYELHKKYGPKEKENPKDDLDIILFSNNQWCYYYNLYSIQYNRWSWDVVFYGTLEYWMFLKSNIYKEMEIK